MGLATKNTAQARKSHEADEESASSAAIGCSPLLAARLERALRLGGARALECPELLVSVRVRVRVRVRFRVRVRVRARASGRVRIRVRLRLRVRVS